MPWDNGNKDKPLNAKAPAHPLPAHSPNEVDSDTRLDALADLSQRLLASARRRGASQAEV